MRTSHQDTPGHRRRPWITLRLLAGFMFLASVSLFVIPTARAQGLVQDLAMLEIELWPDYDQPSVLVLLTGTLADDVAVPASVVLPLPEEASIHAVAHVNVESGALENISDVDSSTSGQLTFTTPSPTFRIEYYIPYESDGDRRDIVFGWQSDMTVEQLLTAVQQPAGATGFELTPASEDSVTRGDGLLYHSLPAQALPAGQSFEVEASYDLPGGQLSAELIEAQQPAVQGPLPVISDSATSDGGTDFNWALAAIVAGGLIVIAAVAWFLYTSSSSGRKRTPRPRPVRQPKPRNNKPTSAAAGAQFCHNCGQAVDPEDRFCRECGTALKGR